LLSAYRPQPDLTGPVVQGSTLLAERPGGRDPLLLYSGPAEPNERAAMTLRVSSDEGVSWRDGVRLSDSPAAYSDLVQLDTATVGLLYETGADTAYDTITFARVPVDEL
jgi:sialidase-1